MHWGNKEFCFPDDPYELQLTAANHDQGWQQWETNPRINAENRPTDFMEMPVDEHLKIWRQSIALAASQSRYGAVLVSRHGRYLNERRTAARNGGTDAAQIKNFCDTYRQWEIETVADLALTPYFASMCQPNILQANVRLLQVFDWLSLLLCMDKLAESEVLNVPGASADERVTLALSPQSERCLTVSPWPFASNAFAVAVQYRQLPAETFIDDTAFRRAWRQTPVKVLTIELKSA